MEGFRLANRSLPWWVVGLSVMATQLSIHDLGRYHGRAPPMASASSSSISGCRCGSILGVFLLALVRRARAAGAFYGLFAGMGVVAAVSFLTPSISFLWHNVIGAVTVLAVGLLPSHGGAERRDGMPG